MPPTIGTHGTSAPGAGAGAGVGTAGVGVGVERAQLGTHGLDASSPLQVIPALTSFGAGSLPLEGVEGVFGMLVLVPVGAGWLVDDVSVATTPRDRYIYFASAARRFLRRTAHTPAPTSAAPPIAIHPYIGNRSGPRLSHHGIPT